jgi:ubiquinone/menaquinone biosynthesis C-methylase UbiE
MGTWEDERATAAGYDRWAAVYDDRDPSTWLDEPFLLEKLHPFPGCRILDMGCGTGRYLRHLTPFEYRIIGVDLSRGMLDRARQSIAKRTDITLLQGSVTRLPFRRCSFDRIMSGLVIDHIELIEQFFHQMASVLTTHGLAVVAAVHPDMQRMTGADIDIRGAEEVVRVPGHIHEVSDLLTAAREAHMTVIAMDEPLVTPPMAERCPAWNRKVGRPALLLLALAKNDQRRA